MWSSSRKVQTYLYVPFSKGGQGEAAYINGLFTLLGSGMPRKAEAAYIDHLFAGPLRESYPLTEDIGYMFDKLILNLVKFKPSIEVCARLEDVRNKLMVDVQETTAKTYSTSLFAPLQTLFVYFWQHIPEPAARKEYENITYAFMKEISFQAEVVIFLKEVMSRADNASANASINPLPAVQCAMQFAQSLPPLPPLTYAPNLQSS